MHLATRIAIRYALTFRSFHFITIISIISAVGIIVGTCALVCVMSIFNGFREFTEQQLTQIDPHIRISAARGASMDSADSIASVIESLEGVSAAVPNTQGRIAVLRRGNLQVAQLIGIDYSGLARLSAIPKSVIDGYYSGSVSEDTPSLLIGALLANNLQLAPRDTVSLVSPLLIESSIKSFRPSFGLRAAISGIFYCNAKEYDESYIYTDRRTANRLLSVSSNSANSIDIRLKDIENTESTKGKICDKFPELKAETWYDLHSDLYNIMKMERLSTFVVIGLIVMIAVFNIFASMTMTVVEKQRDIAVMKAIGARTSLIRRVYMTQGLLVGCISTVIGVGLGLALCYGQIRYGWIGLDGQKFIVEALPVAVDFGDVISTAVFSLVLSTLAAVFPARKAAESTIMQGIRNE